MQFKILRSEFFEYLLSKYKIIKNKKKQTKQQRKTKQQ